MVLGIFVRYFLNSHGVDGWHYGTNWYPLILVVPGLVTDVSLIGDALKNNKVSRSLISFIERLGKYTFSIYLWHIFAIALFRYLQVNGTFYWILIIIGSVLWGVIYEVIIRKIVNLFEKNK